MNKPANSWKLALLSTFGIQLATSISPPNIAYAQSIEYWNTSEESSN